jgi:PAS domain S-box-containing protein
VATGRAAIGRQLTFALLDIERRRQAEAAMSVAQASLRRVIEAAPLAIALLDARTFAIVQANDVAAAAVGSTPERLLGKTPDQILPAASAAERRRDLESALAASDVTTREYRFRTDGVEHVWDARLVPLVAAGEAPDQILLVASDVTEQRAAQEARLEAAIAQREMLVREVHHRIKNNLQGVAGLLQQIGERKPEVAASIDEVVGQVQAIAQVYGLQVGSDGPLSIVSVLEAITGSVQRTFGRTIRCQVAGPDASAWSLPEVEAIPIALTLNELLTNAVKHSTNGSSDDAIDCVLDCDDDRVRVAISNRARLPDGFSLARIPNGVSGLGLVRALLPKKSASLSIEQRVDDVVATVTLRPPGVQRAGA